MVLLLIILIKKMESSSNILTLIKSEENIWINMKKHDFMSQGKSPFFKVEIKGKSPRK